MPVLALELLRAQPAQRGCLRFLRWANHAEPELKVSTKLGQIQFSSTSSPSESSTLDLLRPLEHIERDIARLVLEGCRGNKTRAAETLGISRTTMWRLLKD